MRLAEPKKITVLADTVLRAEQLDESAAADARKKAEEALKGAGNKEDLAHAQAAAGRGRRSLPSRA